MFGNEDSTITGVFSARDPPDLIPNSEVKTRSGDIYIYIYIAKDNVKEQTAYIFF